MLPFTLLVLPHLLGDDKDQHSAHNQLIKEAGPKQNCFAEAWVAQHPLSDAQPFAVQEKDQRLVNSGIAEPSGSATAV